MTDIDLEKELEKRSYAKRELRLSSNSISDFFSKNLGAPDIGRDLTFFEHEKWTEKNHEVTYNAWQVNDYYNIKFFVNQNQYGTGNYKRWERDGYVLFDGCKGYGEYKNEIFIFKLDNRRETEEELDLDD